LLSFFKSDWHLSDYPLEYRHQKNPPQIGRLIPIKWQVRIVNWGFVAGHGQTKEEALANLHELFEDRKRSGLKLPRPGTRLPTQFASTVGVSKYREIAEEFFPAVLSLHYGSCWISDKSSLWDFHNLDNNDHLNSRIREFYGIDISDIEDGNLLRIFQRLAKHKGQQRPL